jgi:hypothetical protein
MHPEGGGALRTPYVAYGVRTVSRTVLGTVLGPCVARRTVRLTDLGFKNSILDTEICLVFRGNNTRKQ